MNITEKIKILLIKLKMSQTDVAFKSGQSHANFGHKLTRNDMKISELERIAKACGVGLEVNFILENGERI